MDNEYEDNPINKQFKNNPILILFENYYINIITMKICMDDVVNISKAI